MDDPSVSTVVEQHIRKMKDVLKGHVTTKTMLDVESKVCFIKLYVDVLSTTVKIAKYD